MACSVPEFSKDSLDKLAKCLTEIGKKDGFINSDDSVPDDIQQRFDIELLVKYIPNKEISKQKLELEVQENDKKRVLPLSIQAPLAIGGWCFNWNTHKWQPRPCRN